MKIVPWLPTGVTQPSMSSFNIFTRNRMTSTSSSFTGPSTTSPTSSTSRRRMGLLSLMLLLLVMTVSFETFMKQRMRPMMVSLEMAPSSSSSKYWKSLVMSSSDRMASSFLSPSTGGLSHFSKKAWKSLSPTRPSLSLSMAVKVSSLPSCFWRWWKRSTLMASLLKPSSSSVSFFATSARNFPTFCSDFEIWPSRFFTFPVSFWDSTLTKPFNSGSSGSPKASMSVFAALTYALASLTSSSTSSANGVISFAFIDLALVRRGLAAASSFCTSSPASSTFLEASSILSFNNSFFSSRAFSLASRASRRFASRAFSREIPTAAFSRRNESKVTPRLPSSTKTLKMASMSLTGIVNENSPLE
mmetsp:Transcript_82542/g.230151  ORF Transcript_82542/g.230151 Transcript_82542/m.230151 type:complete len:359 (-) Transcript_82542:1834-2910(-)